MNQRISSFIFDSYDGPSYNINMKVTALLPDELVNEVQRLSQGKNITESLKIALNDWIKIQQLRILNSKVKNSPLVFEYTADQIRSANRR